MEFKEAFQKIEFSLMQKLLAKCPSQEQADQERFVFELYKEQFERFRAEVAGEFDLPEMAMFLGKMLGMSCIDFMAPGHSPEQAKTALTELEGIFSGAFVGLAHTMYGAREHHLQQQQRQQLQEAQQPQTKGADSNRVIDLSKLKVKP